jgi:phosphonate transport system substrate-binding protein
MTAFQERPVPTIVDLRSREPPDKREHQTPGLSEIGAGRPAPGEDVMTCTRRTLLLGAAALAAPMVRAQDAAAFRFALTPVFLDNDAGVISGLRAALAEGTGRQIDLVQRRTYQEISGALLDGSVDAAWTCGFPYLQHRDRLSLLGVPVWNGQPLYQSYLIAGAEDPAQDLADLRGGTHAFSDPDSNSGYLVTASDLMAMGVTPEGFFARSIFTFGHRNVVRAVAGGLTRSGSVDGYVWEVLRTVEPGLTARTRIVARSDWLGFPPFVARSDRRDDPDVAAFGAALLGLAATAQGRAALDLLYLDGVTLAEPALFDGIAARMAVLAAGP